MSVIVTPRRSTFAVFKSPDISPAKQAAVVLGAVAIGFALTILFGPLITRAIFVFLYGAVAASAAYAGTRGGIAASLLSTGLVAYFIAPPTDSIRIENREDQGSIIAFMVMSSLLSVLVASLRAAQRAAEQSSARLREQTSELEAQQETLQSLMQDLEESNAELESAMEDANLARDEAVTSEERVRLVDEASRVLASSLDYETTVAATAKLAVPTFADWCAVDLVIDGEIKQLAIAHIDPDKAEWARQLGARYPVDANAPAGVPAVIRTGQPQLVPVVTEDMLRAGARDPDHLEILRTVGVRSAIIVPMSARDETLGALTLIRGSDARPYDNLDLTVACDIGRRAAAAIDNARLYRSALVANEAKANFLATMSHELRTPLTAIIGYEELLAEGVTGNVTDLQRQQLHRIKVSALHLLSLIEEILLFARVEAGRETVRIESVTVKNVVEDAIAFVAPSVGDRDISIRAEPIEASLTVETDLGKVRQMLVNLLANAVKFTVRGNVIVRGFAADDAIIFEVEDTGIGIPQQHLEHIFDPFWQVEQHAARTVGGSGLGLSVTRNLATLLGGTVTVTSIPLAGSTFRITLPRSRAF